MASRRSAEILLVACRRVHEKLELQSLVVFPAKLHPTPVEIDETLRVVLLLVERDEVVDRESARRLELERSLVGVDRARRILQHVALRLADPPPRGRACLVVRNEVGLLR